MASQMILPTFFVIGAPKCGTTSLHAYLDLHPEIEMTRVKEPALFAGEDRGPSRLRRYASLFAADAPVRGESSAVYSQYPRWPEVPERIHEQVPDARFVYLVRDPIERAIAHWAMHVADGKEARALADALADFEQPDSLYVCPSRYATQVQRYLEQFGPERILVLDQVDLLHARELTLGRAFSFLGVDPRFRSPAFTARLNLAEEQRAATVLGRRLAGSRALAAARRVPPPAALRGRARRALSRPVERPALDEGLRARIADSLREEASWLRRFTGQCFEGWSI